MLYTKSDKIQQYTLGRKGGSNTGNLADNLMEELNCEKVFTLPVLGGINESVVVTWIITVLLYLACSNTIAPLFGFKPPTKDLNVTAALAIMSMCLIEFSGIRKNGFGHWAKHFAQPIPIVAPIMILEIVIRPLSLCMRLFGNMLAGFVVMELLKAIVPLIIPIPISFYFDIFDGLLQAYVFVFLTSLFMNEEME